MAPEELRDDLKRQPFEPFRLVMTDGQAYDIFHPDLLWVGLHSAYVGLTGDMAKALFERSVKVDLFHIIRIEPLAHPTPTNKNGQAAN